MCNATPPALVDQLRAYRDLLQSQGRIIETRAVTHCIRLALRSL